MFTNTIAELYRHNKPPKEFRFGVELENEADRHVEVNSDYWQIKADNSLRGAGYEFVTKALTRERLDRALMAWSARFKDAARWSNSVRTSTHVHVEVNQLTVPQVFSFFCLYNIFEPALVHLTKPYRHGNCFALRETGCSGNLQHFIKMLKVHGDGVFARLNEDRNKYASLNLCRVHDLGTVESRIFHGTDDMNEVSDWVDYLEALRTNTDRIENPTVLDKMFIDLDPMDFSKEFLGSKLTRRLEKNIPEPLEKLLRDGYNTMYPLMRVSIWKDKKVQQEAKKKTLDPFDLEDFIAAGNAIKFAAARAAGAGAQDIFEHRLDRPEEPAPRPAEPQVVVDEADDIQEEWWRHVVEDLNNEEDEVDPR